MIAGQDLKLGLSLRNILDEAHEEFQESDTIGRTEYNTYDRGRSFSASLTMRF
jgi:outer membrane receptor protein involved in Fe transport